MALAFDVKDLVKTGTRLVQEREQLVRLLVVVADDAPAELLDEVEAALVPRTSLASVEVRMASEVAATSLAGFDAAVVLTGSDSTLRSAVAEVQRAGVPLCALVVAAAESDSLATADNTALRLGMPTSDVLCGEDGAQLVSSRLGVWVVDRVSGKRLALAHNFPVFRRAAAEDAVRVTAAQNGLVGVVLVIPGADMPVMTLNQAKMLLQIAATYGQPVNAGRARELAAVVAGGFALRTAARQILALIPGFGWIVKGGIAYAGTMAMGTAAIKWFEDGADVTTVARELSNRAGEVAERVRALSPGARGESNDL